MCTSMYKNDKDRLIAKLNRDVQNLKERNDRIEPILSSINWDRVGEDPSMREMLTYLFQRERMLATVEDILADKSINHRQRLKKVAFYANAKLPICDF